MTSATIEGEITVENVYIFVSDALRWSSLPAPMKKRGATYKTIASGCATMKSVSSIVSGVYPPKHGVRTWRDRITRFTLFDLPSLSIGYYNSAAAPQGGLNQVLDQQSKDNLSEISPPFIFFERDQGGHAPYRNYSQREMIEKLNHKDEELQTYYDEAIENSIERFDERLDVLSDRGLIDDTLIIFMSDHGELLGEHGLVSHSSPIVPELVYVPSVFIHPDLSQGLQSEVIGHVDVFPTILSAIESDFEPEQCDGVNLFSHRPGVRYNEASHFKQFVGRRVNIFHSGSVWDGNGGHVFNQRGKLSSPLIGYLKARGWNKAYWKANPTQIPTALSRYLLPHIQYGSPELSKSDSAEIIKKIQQDKNDAERIDIDEKVEKRLKDLGYRP
jgi:hypothetical protein